MGLTSETSGCHDATWAAEDCVDMEFLAARGLTLGIAGLERGLRRAAIEHGGVVRAIYGAVRSELHVLRREPESLAVRIQYRLRCAGQSSREIERQLRFPPGQPSPSVRFSNAPRRDHFTLTGHTRGIWRCAVTPDGMRAISASRDGTLRVWDLDRAEELRVLQRAPEEGGLAGERRQPESYELRDCAALDNQRVVAACADGTLSIWDVTTGARLAHLRGHERRVLSCSLTPDRRQIVSASSDKTVRVWDASCGALLRVYSGHTAEVRRSLVTPDGERVVSADCNGVVKVWELGSARELFTFRVANSLQTFVLSPDCRHAVAADRSRSGGLGIWRLDSGKRVGSLIGDTQSARPLAVTPNGRLISSSGPTTVQVWDLEAQTELARFGPWEDFGHSDVLLDCVVLADGAHVLNSSWDGHLTLWNLDEALRTASIRQRPVEEQLPVAFAATPDAQRVLGINRAGDVQVFGTANGRLLETTQCSLTAPWTFTTGNEVAVLTDGGKGLQAVELGAQPRVHTLAGEGLGLGPHAVRSDERYVVVFLLPAKRIGVWELQSGMVYGLLDARQQRGYLTLPAQRCALHEGRLLLWDEIGELVADFAVGADEIFWSSSLDGRWLASWTLGQTEVRVFDLPARQLIRRLSCRTGAGAGMVQCAFTPDGRLVTAVYGDSVSVWCCVTGALLSRFRLGYGGFYARFQRSFLAVAQGLVCLAGPSGVELGLDFGPSVG